MVTRLSISLSRAAMSITLLVSCGSCTQVRKTDSHPGATPEFPRASIPMPTLMDVQPREYPGIHNAVAYHEGYVSGSVPEGDAGFDSLAAMGVKTIISVDGAEPDVHRAKARGMKYIHLPIGYNGFDEQRKLQLVRATRDAMKHGPVYIHCHHGRHRSAGAAAAIVASLGWATPEQGLERMRVSGTAANYKGLWACATNATVLPASLINNVPGDFPSVWKPTGFVKGMVEMDHVYDLLKAAEKAGWTTPTDHPDLIPAAEAGRLADLFRVLTETEYVAGKRADFAAVMREGESASRILEDMIVAGEQDATKLSAQFRRISASCKDCHAKYRD